MQKQIEQIQEKLQEKLTQKRFVHTLGVRYTAASLAMRYGVSVEDASLAGVLHDCAKCYTDEQLYKRCKKHGIKISTTEQESRYLLHAKLGAYYAKERYGVNDEGILSAIRYHTTGKPGMTLLEQIVFTADYIEPGRKPLPHLDAVRQMAFIDLNEAVYYILHYTLSYLEDGGKKGNNVDKHTLEAYEYYKKIRNSGHDGMQRSV